MQFIYKDSSFTLFILCLQWYYSYGACPSLNSTATLTVRCEHDNKTLDNCENPIDGTEAYLTCNTYYEDVTLETNPKRSCREGKWDGPTPQCYPNHCNCEPQQTVSKRSTFVPYKTPYKLAVLVPFRDRFEELLTFAPYIHNFLNEQGINHDIFILNQMDKYRFNRASLINVGYLYTKDNYDYVAMHDVDLLPLNRNLSYAYPKLQPFHVAAPNLHPRYHYEKFVGGILLVNREQFSLVNGMSNKYWGWGLEDDEFFVRLRDANLNITRPTNITTGTSNTFRHIHDKNHRKRDTTKCFNQREVTRKRDRQTGLNNVNYSLLSVTSMNIEGAPLKVLNIELKCDHSLTPWCDCTDNKKTSIKI